MQKTENYKQSEVGLIPEDWEVERLESLTLKIGSGITPTGGSSVYKQEGRPFLRSQNVGWGNLLLDDIVFIDEQTHMTFPSTEIKSGDVFLNITGASIGRSSYASKHVLGGNVNQHVCIIRPQQEKLTSLYLNHFLLSNRGQKQIDSFQSGGNRQGLNFGQIKTFLIPLPPLPEQTAIASALSDMDALIAQTEKLIEKKKAIKQGVMQELLTGKKRLKGFENSKGYKQTEVGVIPEDWECVKLKKVIKSMPDYGIGAAAVEFSLNLPVYLRITDISEDGDFLKSNISSVNSDQSRNYILGKGEVVVARTGSSVGKTYLYNPNDGELVFAGFLIRIRPDEQRLNSEFLFCLTQSKYYKDWIVTNSMRSGQPGINSVQISNLNIPLPPIEEQKSIASSIIDINNEIKVLDRRIEKLKLQKQGMMQALLTGKIRLV